MKTIRFGAGGSNSGDSLCNGESMANGQGLNGSAPKRIKQASIPVGKHVGV